jgi:hypothetical protein
MTTRGGGVGDPKVSPTMTGELWFALAVGLSALAWHALHWWVLVIPAVCLFVALVQHGSRVQAARQLLDGHDDRVA